MIDDDQLERDVDAEAGDLVLFKKDTVRELIAEIRIGRAARRSLVNLQSMLTVAAATSGMRVPHGYRGPRPVPTP